MKLKENYAINSLVLSNKTDQSILSRSEFILTDKNQFMAVSYGNHLIYCGNDSILSSKDLNDNEMDIEYFLSPTNIPIKELKFLQPIKGTDNLLALDFSNRLVRITYENNSVIRMFNLNKIFSSFKLYDRTIVAHNTENSEIIISNIDENKLVHKFTCSAITKYGLDSSKKYLYLVEKEIFKTF